MTQSPLRSYHIRAIRTLGWHMPKWHNKISPPTKWCALIFFVHIIPSRTTPTSTYETTYLMTFFSCPPYTHSAVINYRIKKLLTYTLHLNRTLTFNQRSDFSDFTKRQKKLFALHSRRQKSVSPVVVHTVGLADNDNRPLPCYQSRDDLLFTMAKILKVINGIQCFNGFWFWGSVAEAPSQWKLTNSILYRARYMLSRNGANLMWKNSPSLPENCLHPVLLEISRQKSLQIASTRVMIARQVCNMCWQVHSYQEINKCSLFSLSETTTTPAKAFYVHWKSPQFSRVRSGWQSSWKDDSLRSRTTMSAVLFSFWLTTSFQHSRESRPNCNYTSSWVWRFDVQRWTPVSYYYSPQLAFYALHFNPPQLRIHHMQHISSSLQSLYSTIPSEKRGVVISAPLSLRLWLISISICLALRH